MLDLSLTEYNPLAPGFYVILVTALFSFVLSSLIAITYEYTTKSIFKKAHFLQSLILIGIVAATVMQAIGDSVGRGLGMLGALSIIRFRTVLNDPRNITFMFASLAAGIACGVLGITIALTGTLIFCLAAIILRFSPMSNAKELIGELKLQVPKNNHSQLQSEKVLSKYCHDFQLEQIRFLSPKTVKSYSSEGVPCIEQISRENIQELTYLIRLKRKTSINEINNAITNDISGLEGLKLNFKQQEAKL